MSLHNSLSSKVKRTKKNKVVSTFSKLLETNAKSEEVAQNKRSTVFIVYHFGNRCYNSEVILLSHNNTSSENSSVLTQILHLYGTILKMISEQLRNWACSRKKKNYLIRNLHCLISKVNQHKIRWSSVWRECNVIKKWFLLSSIEPFCFIQCHEAATINISTMRSSQTGH